MRRRRQSKLILIAALCVSVLGLTLGFAAFSNSLTISSSANVSPEETDFNINVYGIGPGQGLGGYPPLNMYNSTTESEPVKGLNTSPAAISATTAKITDAGKSITISDLKAVLSEPEQSADYFFLIKNEGQYDAYLDLTESFETFSLPQYGTCTPGSDATEDLVTATCDYINLYNILESSDGAGYSGGEYVEIPKGDYLKLNIHIYYDNNQGASTPRADGEFSVDFEDLVLNFTSVPPES